MQIQILDRNETARLHFFGTSPMVVNAFDSFGKNLEKYTKFIAGWLGSDYVTLSCETCQSTESTVGVLHVFPTPKSLLVFLLRFHVCIDSRKV